MKKQLLTVAALTFATATFAQVTITQADFGSVGDAFHKGTDSSPGVAVGSPGSNQTWNFQTLNTESLDTLNFLAPGSTPFGGSFGGANLATESNEGYIYFDKAAGYVHVEGFATTMNNLSVVLDYNPPQTLINFPASMGTNYSSTSNATTTMYVGIDSNIVVCQLQIDSIRFKRTTTLNVNFDADGSLRLPMDTVNAVRAFSQENTMDSIFIFNPNVTPTNCVLFIIPPGWSLAPNALVQQLGYSGSVIADTTRLYSWYANGEDFAICAIEVNAAGTPQSASFKSDASQIGLAAPNYDVVNTVKIFPNPASETLNFMLPADFTNGTVEIIDISGRKVSSASLNSSSISLQGLANGLYSYRLFSDNALISTGKFEVRH